MKIIRSKHIPFTMEVTQVVTHYDILYKHAETEQDQRFIQRHHECLRRLHGTGTAPRSLLQDGTDYGYGHIGGEKTVLWPEEDLGTGEVVTMGGEVAFQRGCIHLLRVLRDRGIHHGDLTRHNIVVRNGVPVAIDFHQSLFVGETAVPKRPEPDAFWLWHAASELSPDTTRRIRRWRKIREYLQPGETLVSYGCADGDFVAMADAEGVEAVGYDINPLASEGIYGRFLTSADITQLKDYRCDTALFMSVFPHLIKNHGHTAALETLSKIIQYSRQCFFETQLSGDGPGPVYFRSDDDVLALLERSAHGKRIDKIVTVPVYGRTQSRTVWRIY